MKKHTLVKIFAAGLGIAMLLTGCPNDTTPPPEPECDCPTNGMVHITDDANYTCCEGGEACTCKTEVKTRVIGGITVVNESNASIAANVSKIEGAIGSVNAHLINEMKSKSGAKIIVETGDYGNYKQEGNAVKISIALTSNQSQLSEILKNAFLAIAGVENEYYLDYNVKVVNQTDGQFRDGLIGDITTALNYFADPSYEFFSISDVSARYPEIIITNGTSGSTMEAFDGNTVKIGNEYIPDDYYVYIVLETTLTNMLQRSDPKDVSMNKFKSDIRLALAGGKGMKTADRQASFAYVGSAGVPGPFFLDKNLSNGICHLVHG